MIIDISNWLNLIIGIGTLAGIGWGGVVAARRTLRGAVEAVVAPKLEEISRVLATMKTQIENLAADVHLIKTEQSQIVQRVQRLEDTVFPRDTTRRWFS